MSAVFGAAQSFIVTGVDLSGSDPGKNRFAVAFFSTRVKAG